MLDLPLTLTVPVFPRVTDYAGLWAIEPAAAGRLVDLARRTDLRLHVQAAETPKLQSTAEIVKAGAGRQVAVVRLAGTLMKATSSMDASTSTVQARRDLRKAAADPEVSAILLAIDSPGGTVAGTADLGADVRAAAKQKPVWAFCDDLCASAAYWVASQADRVYANAGTALVGSIGTVAVVYDLSAAAEKEGVKTLVFNTGPIKGAGTPGTVVNEEHRAYFQGLVNDAQQSFDAAVRKGRGLTEKQLADARTGGVFPAAEALRMGLIDGIKSYDAVVTELAQEAGRQQRADSRAADAPVPLRSAVVNETEILAATGVPTAGPGTVPNVAVTIAAGQTVPNFTPVVPAATTPAVPDHVAQMRTEAASELTRQAQIRRVCEGHPAIAAQAIAEGWSAERAENAALKASLPNGVRAFNPGYNPGLISRSHDRDCSLQALQAAMILRSGGRLDARAYQAPGAFAVRIPEFLRAGINDPERNRLMENGHRLSSLSLVDLCREAIRLDGRDVPHDRDSMIQAAFSGGSLTSIFTTNVNAILLVGFLEAPDTTMGWTTSTDVADFKTQERIRLQALGGSLPKLPRGGEADHEKRADLAESYKIARYASQIVIDEQDIIDDSLNAFAQTAPDMAKKAARLRPDLVYAIILANPTLTATGRALFNVTDGNLGSSSALAAPTLKAGITAVGLVQENSVSLNLGVTHLIVPPALRFTAKELRNSSQIVIAGTAGSVTERGNANVLADEDFQIVSDSRLENGVTDPNSGTFYAGSTSTWYLGSTQGQTIEVAYRSGTGRVPQVRSFVLDKGKYGVGWDICLDIGAKALEWRTMRKTTA